MKHLGKKPRKCRCRDCVGDGNSKSTNKAIKHGARQELKKEIKKDDKVDTRTFNK